jgi:hypothetical protein
VVCINSTGNNCRVITSININWNDHVARMGEMRVLVGKYECTKPFVSLKMS